MAPELTVHLLDTRSLWPGDDIFKAVSCLLNDLTSEERKQVKSCGDLEEARALLGRRLVERAYVRDQSRQGEGLAGENGSQSACSWTVDTKNARDCGGDGIRFRPGDAQSAKPASQTAPVQRTAHASGLAVAIALYPKPSLPSTSSPSCARTFPAPEAIGHGLSADVAIEITKIPTIAALAEIEELDFAAYAHEHFGHLLSDEELFSLVYTLGDGSYVKLLDGRVLRSQDVGRSDRVVEMGQKLSVTLTHRAREREGGGNGGREEVISYESDRIIETKLRRLYSFNLLKQALLSLLDDDSLRIGDVELHNVLAPEPGTAARCSVLGCWGELVAGEVEIWVRGVKRENVWLGVQGYEEDYLIGIAVAMERACNMEHSANGWSWLRMKPDVKFNRVGIEEVLELFKQTGA